MIAFDPARVGFGRHETFPLRFGWLTKGYRAWCENPQLLKQSDPMVVLGVGKNMVSSIRYWMDAAQIVGESADTDFGPTDLGEYIFDSTNGRDPYLEDDTTLWLLHWLIASNPEQATTIYWFFNRFHKPEFTSAEVLAALKDFSHENLRVRVAETTLKNDVAVLLRGYETSVISKSMPIEEGLDSPLSSLGLIQRSKDGKLHISRPSERRRLPVAAMGYAVLELFEGRQLTSISLGQLLHGDSQFASPGGVFRLSEEGLITKLEELIRWMPGVFELRESAGIHQLYKIQDVSKFEMLDRHYPRISVEEAA